MPDGILPHGEVTVRRASHIWPVHPIKRAAFRILRLAFGERGQVAAWTRRWKGGWQAILIDSQRTFTHPSRRVCLDWERRVLDGGGL